MKTFYLSSLSGAERRYEWPVSELDLTLMRAFMQEDVHANIPNLLDLCLFDVTVRQIVPQQYLFTGLMPYAKLDMPAMDTGGGTDHPNHFEVASRTLSVAFNDPSQRLFNLISVSKIFVSKTLATKGYVIQIVPRMSSLINHYKRPPLRSGLEQNLKFVVEFYVPHLHAKLMAAHVEKADELNIQTGAPTPLIAPGREELVNEKGLLPEREFWWRTPVHPDPHNITFIALAGKRGEEGEEDKRTLIGYCLCTLLPYRRGLAKSTRSFYALGEPCVKRFFMQHEPGNLFEIKGLSGLRNHAGQDLALILLYHALDFIQQPLQRELFPVSHITTYAASLITKHLLTSYFGFTYHGENVFMNQDFLDTQRKQMPILRRLVAELMIHYVQLMETTTTALHHQLDKQKRKVVDQVVRLYQMAVWLRMKEDYVETMLVRVREFYGAGSKALSDFLERNLKLYSMTEQPNFDVLIRKPDLYFDTPYPYGYPPPPEMEDQSRVTDAQAGLRGYELIFALYREAAAMKYKSNNWQAIEKSFLEVVEFIKSDVARESDYELPKKQVDQIIVEDNNMEQPYLADSELWLKAKEMTQMTNARDIYGKGLLGLADNIPLDTMLDFGSLAKNLLPIASSYAEGKRENFVKSPLLQQQPPPPPSRIELTLPSEAEELREAIVQAGETIYGIGLHPIHSAYNCAELIRYIHACLRKLEELNEPGALYQHSDEVRVYV